jgi:hypothetical protein
MCTRSLQHGTEIGASELTLALSDWLSALEGEEGFSFDGKSA